MKTKLIFAGTLVAALNAHAQWDNSTGAVATPNTIRVNGTTAPAAGTSFHVGSGTGPLHYTGGGDGSMQIKGSFGDRAILELEEPGSTPGLNKLIIQNVNSTNAAYFNTTNGRPLYIQGGGGNIGINQNAAGYQLDVASGVANDGINIKQTTTQAAALHLTNSTTGGRHWAMLSTGLGSAQGAGHFSIYDYTAAKDRLFVHSSGHVGIGTNAPLYQLDVQTGGTNDGISITNTSGAGAALHLQNNGLTTHYAMISKVFGDLSIFDYNTNKDALIVQYGTDNVAIGHTSPMSRLDVRENTGSNYSAGLFVMSNSSQNIGIQAEAFGGTYNTAGQFIISGGAGNNFALYASAPTAAANYAGYFDGNVYMSKSLYVVGTAGCTAMAWTSDRMLKKDIKQMTNSLDKIAKLKPSTYNFRTDEFEAANLPSGTQLGLIAQELEEVYPELVSEMAEQKNYDGKGNVTGTIPAHKTVNYIGLIPVLIGGIQEQQAQIDAQKATIAQQQQVNSDLQNQIDELSQKLSTSTGINSTNPGANGFSMLQNEPNPFSHETVINYTLPQTITTADLIVYDLTGKQLATFPVTDKGTASMTITSEKLAAGIYIYSLVADGKVVDSKRMIVAEK